MGQGNRQDWRPETNANRQWEQEGQERARKGRKWQQPWETPTFPPTCTPTPSALACRVVRPALCACPFGDPDPRLWRGKDDEGGSHVRTCYLRGRSCLPPLHARRGSLSAVIVRMSRPRCDDSMLFSRARPSQSTLARCSRSSSLTDTMPPTTTRTRNTPSPPRAACHMAALACHPVCIALRCCAKYGKRQATSISIA